MKDIKKLLNKCKCGKVLTEDDIYYDGYFKCSKCNHKDDSKLSWIQIGENVAIIKIIRMLKDIKI